MPPPMPLPGTGAASSSGSQPWSASSAAKRGRIAARAASGDGATGDRRLHVGDEVADDGRVENVLVAHVARHSLHCLNSARRRRSDAA